MRSQKSQNFQNLAKKEKLQSFGLSPKKPSRFFFRKEKGGFIVFDSLNSKIFFINKTAKKILTFVDNGLPKEKVIEHISRIYSISKEEAFEGVNSILEEIK